MKCEYCNGSQYLIERDRTTLSRRGDFYPGIDMGIYGNVLFIEGCADTYEPNYIEDGVEIKFCPMCGRELEAIPKDETW